MVISGGNFKPDTLKPKEVVSLLLDDEEIELKCKLLLKCITVIIMQFNFYILYSQIGNEMRKRK